MTVLTNRWKFDILDHFGPRVKILKIELGSNYEYTESMDRLV